MSVLLVGELGGLLTVVFSKQSTPGPFSRNTGPEGLGVKERSVKGEKRNLCGGPPRLCVVLRPVVSGGPEADEPASDVSSEGR